MLKRNESRSAFYSCGFVFIVLECGQDEKSGFRLEVMAEK